MGFGRVKHDTAMITGRTAGNRQWLTACPGRQVENISIKAGVSALLFAVSSRMKTSILVILGLALTVIGTPAQIANLSAGVNPSTAAATALPASKARRVVERGANQRVMQDYANTSCGWYLQLSASPSSADIENAILDMIYTAGACH
jgi:hypothetical protein